MNVVEIVISVCLYISLLVNFLAIRRLRMINQGLERNASKTEDEMLTVACVYKKDHDPRYWATDVAALRDGVAKHLSMRHRFVCLTDDAIGVMFYGIEATHLLHDLPAWWSKMELFSLPGPVLYLDLDTVVLGSLDRLAQGIIDANAAVMLRDFYSGLLASGVMGWNAACDLSWVLPSFLEDSRLGVYEPGISGPSLCSQAKHWAGDQDWLRHIFEWHATPVVYAQDIADGIYSYKVHTQGKDELPADASLVCFHGRPRINEVMDREPWLAGRRKLHSMGVRP